MPLFSLIAHYIWTRLGHRCFIPHPGPQLYHLSVSESVRPDNKTYKPPTVLHRSPRCSTVLNGRSSKFKHLFMSHYLHTSCWMEDFSLVHQRPPLLYLPLPVQLPIYLKGENSTKHHFLAALRKHYSHNDECPFLMLSPCHPRLLDKWIIQNRCAPSD